MVFVTSYRWQMVLNVGNTRKRGFTAQFVRNERDEYKISYLVRVKQGMTPVCEYIREFQRITMKLQEFFEKIIIDLFIEGVHPESRKIAEAPRLQSP